MFYFIEGPKLPEALSGHSSFALGNELILLGGQANTGSALHFSPFIYKMSCNNGTFSEWIEMEVELKIPRSFFVASFIPNYLIDSQSAP